jgi:hypothetical protein
MGYLELFKEARKDPPGPAPVTKGSQEIQVREYDINDINDQSPPPTACWSADTRAWVARAIETSEGLPAGSVELFQWPECGDDDR